MGGWVILLTLWVVYPSHWYATYGVPPKPSNRWYGLTPYNDWVIPFNKHWDSERPLHMVWVVRGVIATTP